ncbi:MAG: hypothetical protein ACYCSS_10845 [Sulfuriferula sp.]
MKKSGFMFFVLTVLSIPASYADGPQGVPNMGNMSVGMPSSPNTLPQQNTQKAIMQSNSHSYTTIMQDKAQERMGRRMDGSGMQNGMNSSMGAR